MNTKTTLNELKQLMTSTSELIHKAQLSSNELEGSSYYEDQLKRNLLGLQEALVTLEEF